MRNEKPKKKRLRKGGVGPEMRSLAGLSLKYTTGAARLVQSALLTGAVSA